MPDMPLHPRGSLAPAVALLCLSWGTLATPALSLQQAQVQPASDSSVEAAQSFAQRLEKSLRAGHGESFLQLFLVEAWSDKVTGGIEATEGFEQGFREQLPAALSSLAHAAGQAVHAGGDYRLLRTSKKDGTHSALFRLVSAEGGLNYHRFDFKSAPSGDFTCADCYLFSTGEFLSETLRASYQPAAARAWTRQGKALSKELRRSMNMLEALEKAKDLMSRGEWQLTLDHIAELPESLRHSKALMLLNINSAAQLGAEKHARAVSAYRDRYPGNSATLLLDLDLYTLAGDHDALEKAYEALNEATGGDPYTDFMWSANLLNRGLVAEAKQELTPLVTQGDDWLESEARWRLVSIALDEEDHSRTLILLLELIEDRWEIGDLNQSSAYEKFIASPQYLEYLEALK